MAGILKRFSDIMSANLNALLDKAEDPEKMIDQYLRDLQNDLAKVKAETASVMAEETRCKRALDECEKEIADMQSYAEKAVLAGNDDDARQFLAKKQQLENKKVGLGEAHAVAHDNAVKMKEMHDKLCRDISELNSRKEAIKAKVAVAKTQDRVNKVGASAEGAANTMSAFARMEEKADRMLDEVNAMAELNGNSEAETIKDLTAKYDNSTAAVEDELAALKAKLGK